MYQLYRLRELGLRVRVFEAGTGVGGTWYWNRYPGARFDSESYSYGYSFSQGAAGGMELVRAFRRPAGDAALPQLRRRQVRPAPRHPVPAAASPRRTTTRTTRSWDVTLEDGSRFTRALPDHRDRPAVGADPAAHRGRRDFKGQSFHTARWPHEPVDFAGKRVAVIGTGATGVQTIQDSRQDRSATSPCSSARPTGARRCTTARSTPRSRAQDQGRLPRDVRALPGDLRLLHPHARPARHLRGDDGGARGVLGEALRRARLRHLAGQLPRHADRPRGQRADLAISSRARSASG